MMPVTRRDALVLGGGLAAAATLRAQPALAAATDAAALSALVAYQQQVVLEYHVTLRDAPLGGRDREVLEPFRRDAEQAAGALRKALENAGGEPVAAPDPAAAPPPADPSRRGYLHALIAAEEAAVGGYYTSLQAMHDKRHLGGSAAFMAQAGRRLVVLRRLAGRPLVPRAFETGGA